MAKSIVVGGFLMLMVAAFAIFFTRSTTSPKETLMRNAAKAPRVLLEDFSIYRYKDYMMVASLSGKSGAFVEPNIIEMSGNINGLQVRNGREETMRCESGAAYFKSSSLGDMMKNNSLSHAEIDNNVVLELDQNLLQTEHADFLADKQTIVSSKPVQISGPNRVFEGDNGFSYDLDREVLVMNGQIKGVVKPSDVPAK